MQLPDGRIRKTRQSRNIPGHLHELTFSCYDGLPLLGRDRTRQWLIDAIDAARGKHRFRVLAYVIMPTHAHLLIQPVDQFYSVPDILKSIKQPVARRAINYLRSNAPEYLTRLRVDCRGRVEHRFWQAGGGYDRNIWTARAVANSVGYLHRNPVVAGFVEKESDWRWSSAGWYAGMRREAPLRIDSPSERVLARWGFT